jgi:L-ascorbate metabolism protein UlaG (beta-lactamase superfamily)
MEISYYGANCVKITTKKATIVVDDNLSKVGLKKLTKPTDISLRTSSLIPELKEAKFSADMPGEYEISGVIIHGVGARAHMDEDSKKTGVIYTIEADDIRVAVAGHIYPELSEAQLEQIGMIDLLIVPVGGNGYTLDGVGALKVVKQLEPKIVIPTHYADKQIKYDVPQQELADALKGLAMEPAETVEKLKIKPLELTDSTRLIVLERQ